jgi:hypothetical protein
VTDEIEKAVHNAELAEAHLLGGHIQMALVEATLAEAWARIAGAKHLRRSNEVAAEAQRIGMAQGMPGGRA